MNTNEEHIANLHALRLHNPTFAQHTALAAAIRALETQERYEALAVVVRRLSAAWDSDDPSILDDAHAALAALAETP